MDVTLLQVLVLVFVEQTFGHKGPCHKEIGNTTEIILPGSYRPQCKEDGSYEGKQCHPSTGYCWCVRPHNGVEVDGTRKAPGESGGLNCDSCGTPGLYFTNRTSVLCFAINASSGLLLGDKPRVLAKSNGLIRTIGLNPLTKTAYWGDLGLNSIYKIPVDAGHPTELFSYAIGYVQGIGVDWTTNIIYWTDSLMKMVELSDTNGFHRKVLFKLHGDAEPRGLFVDVIRGYLFWSDWGHDPKIERSSLSGDGRITIVSEDVKWPNDLAVDSVTGRLYWIDAYHDTVESVNFDGTERKVIHQMDYTSPHPYSVTYSPNLNVTYWGDWLENSIYASSEKFFGTSSKLVYHEENRLKLKSIGQVRVLEQQPDSGANQVKHCLSSGNKCSHLCLRTAGVNKHVCDCPTGTALVPNISSTVCQKVEKSFEIFFSDSHETSVNHLIKYEGQEGFTISPLPLPTNELMKYPVALDFDPYDGFVYWTDIGNRKTYRMHKDGTGLKKLFQFTQKATAGVAIHKVSKLIFYFTLVNSHQIGLMMSNTLGQFTKTIVQGRFTSPRDIALAEEESLLFFTDDDCVGRVFINGTGFRCFKGQHGVKIHPIGLAVDNVEKRVYWCDSIYYSISSLDFSLNEKSTLLVIQQTFYHRMRFWLVVNTGYVVKPYSMAVLGDKIFWSDIAKRAIYSADKRGGGNIEYVTGGLNKPRDLHVYSDKPLTDYRKIYRFSFHVRRTDPDAAYCLPDSTLCMDDLSEPVSCPAGYRSIRVGSSCSNCSDALGGNFKCPCNDWKTCAERAFAPIKGCHPSRPFMAFRVRECIQTVKPGVCSYKLLSNCILSNPCLSDDDCSGSGKCCPTSCGKRCSSPMKRVDNPCSMNNGGCSHFCITKATSYQCQCPDSKMIDVDGKTCVTKKEDSKAFCTLAPHVGSCHPPKPMTRFRFNVKSGSCEKFLWGGCDRNGNNFKRHGDCERSCSKDKSCTDKCLNGGTCSVLEDYTTLCQCPPRWYGLDCHLDGELGAYSVQFLRYDVNEFGMNELKREIAQRLGSYCQPSICIFVVAASASNNPRRRRSQGDQRVLGEMFDFTEDDILFRDVVISKQEIKLSLVVLKHDDGNKILSEKSLKGFFDAHYRIGGQFGMKLANSAPVSMGMKHKRKPDATAGIVLTLVVAALIVAIGGYVYYRRKEMQRRPPAAEGAPEAQPNVSGTASYVSRLANTIRNKGPSKSRLPDVSRGSNVTHTAFENELYEEVNHAGAVTTGSQQVEYPTQSVANPAYVSQPAPKPPQVQDTHSSSSPNMETLQETTDTAQEVCVSNWVQFDDDGDTPGDIICAGEGVHQNVEEHDYDEPTIEGNTQSEPAELEVNTNNQYVNFSNVILD